MNIELTASILWKTVQRCQGGIVLKLSNSLENSIYALPAIKLSRTIAILGPVRSEDERTSDALKLRGCLEGFSGV